MSALAVSARAGAAAERAERAEMKALVLEASRRAAATEEEPLAMPPRPRQQQVVAPPESPPVRSLTSSFFHISVSGIAAAALLLKGLCSAEVHMLVTTLSCASASMDL